MYHVIVKTPSMKTRDQFQRYLLHVMNPSEKTVYENRNRHRKIYPRKVLRVDMSQIKGACHLVSRDFIMPCRMPAASEVQFENKNIQESSGFEIPRRR